VPHSPDFAILGLSEQNQRSARADGRISSGAILSENRAAMPRRVGGEKDGELIQKSYCELLFYQHGCEGFT